MKPPSAHRASERDHAPTPERLLGRIVDQGRGAVRAINTIDQTFADPQVSTSGSPSRSAATLGRKRSSVNPSIWAATPSRTSCVNPDQGEHRRGLASSATADAIAGSASAALFENEAHRPVTGPVGDGGAQPQSLSSSSKPALPLPETVWRQQFFGRSAHSGHHRPAVVGRRGCDLVHHPVECVGRRQRPPDHGRCLCPQRHYAAQRQDRGLCAECR
jgi:hypothetical protein